MKKIKLTSYGLLIIVLFIYSCKKEAKLESAPAQTIQGAVKLVKNGVLNLPKNSQGKYILEGDMILSNEQANFIIRKSKPPTDVKTESTFQSSFVKVWPEGKVYYKIDNDVPAKYRVYQAITAIQNANAGVTFYEASAGQPNYIRIMNTNNPKIGGLSSIGMIGGEQQLLLNVNEAWAPTGVAIHELLHALGFLHEQSRSDRDSYIRVNYQNIENDFKSQFNTYKLNQFEVEGLEIGTFDFESIMLYSSDSFANAGSYSMTRLDGSPFWGQRYYLSSQDIEGLKYVYQPIYVVQTSVLSNDSYWDFSGAVENVYEKYDVTLRFYKDANHTIPHTLERPLKLINRWASTSLYSGTWGRNVTPYQPGVSEVFLGSTTNSYYSDYGIKRYHDTEGFGIIEGAGYKISYVSR